MNYGIMEALNQITRERRVDKALLYETLEIGLTTAVKKKYGNNAVVQVEIDEESGQLHPYLVKTVVEDENEIKWRKDFFRRSVTSSELSELR